MLAQPIGVLITRISTTVTSKNSHQAQPSTLSCSFLIHEVFEVFSRTYSQHTRGSQHFRAGHKNSASSTAMFKALTSLSRTPAASAQSLQSESSSSTSRAANVFPLLSLPGDLLPVVFSFCSVTDLVGCMQLNSAFHDAIAACDALWQRVVRGALHVHSLDGMTYRQYLQSRWAVCQASSTVKETTVLPRGVVFTQSTSGTGNDDNNWFVTHGGMRLMKRPDGTDAIIVVM